MRHAILMLCAAGCSTATARAQEGLQCDREWTFPVPFYQSMAWSPDGSLIAVAAVTTSWDEGYGIFVVSVNDTVATKLDVGEEGALYPAFSPDGDRVAFTSRKDGNHDIHAMNLDGTQHVRLTDHEANDAYPSWSPDGAKIAFHSNRDGNYEIYVMNADGSDPIRLTNHPADDYNPAWSPGGDRISFDSDRDEVEGDEIYVMFPDGSGLERVVDEGVFPSWSPDGQKILYASDGLWTVESDGSGRARLLEDAVYGAWSPDGSLIAAAAIEYDGNCKDSHSLVLIEIDGTLSKKLLP